MAIAPKPKKNPVNNPAQLPEGEQQKALNFILQGGSVATPTTAQPAPETDDEKTVGVILRMYPDAKRELDDFIRSLPKRYRPSRNAWILQAIEEKLVRDKKIS